MLLLVLCCAMASPREPAPDVAAWNEDIASKIAAVSAANTVDAAAVAAENLYGAMLRRPTADLTQTNVDGVISLLDVQSDAVRMYIALCIERIGRRAHAAVPELREILSSMRCYAERDGVRVGYEQTSEDAVRGALQSVGEKPPPPKCVPPYGEHDRDSANPSGGDAGHSVPRR